MYPQLLQCYESISTSNGKIWIGSFSVLKDHHIFFFVVAVFLRLSAHGSCLLLVLPQTLLDLGAFPDYRDSRGLTPLYHTAIAGGDPCCCEMLLKEQAELGLSDENGWQEIHQVSSFMSVVQ